MDTTNILFICGGAFVGLEKMIARRVGKKALGFRTGEDTRKDAGTIDQAQFRTGLRGRNRKI